MKRVLVLAVIASLAVPVLGDILGNPYDGAATFTLAQDFVWPGTDQLDTWVVSDFTTTQDYYLYDVWSQGWATGSGGEGESANFDIYDAFPWDGGNLILSAADGYDHLHAENRIGANFSGQLLPAGSYYIAFQAVHNFLQPGGNTLIYHSNSGNFNDWEWNPGLGQNWGGPARQIDASGPIDVNWQLTVEAVPEPAALTLLAFAGLLLRRR